MLPDDSGDRKSGHPTASVSRQHLGSRGQLENGVVAATTAPADKRVHHPPAHTSTPHLVTVEPNTPLMTETGKGPHTVTTHPADAMHLPPPIGSAAMSPAATAEQDGKHVRRPLGWADLQDRSGQAVQRH